MRMMPILSTAASLLSASAAAAQQTNAPDAFPVAITVDAAQTKGELKPIWRFFGADEPNYATMKDGRKLLGELGALKLKEVFFRTHNLLTTGDGTPALKWGSTNVYTENEKGEPVYDWKIVDEIFDTYLERGVRPYVQLGFMPKAMSIRPEPYQHSWTPKAKYDEIYTGWAYPPKDYAKWGELAYQWTRHCIERYGRAEVETWYWQVWNEPNIGYWRGTADEFRKLHDFAIDGVRRALPTAKVGGPDMAGGGGKLLRDFLDHNLRGTNYATGNQGTPLDFLSFHAKGLPRFVDGHVRMGIAEQLRDIDATFKIIASYPELKAKPIVIGESDPDGCAACQGAQLGYRNGTLYSSYTAASFARKHELAERHGVNLEGALTWAFEFENQSYFAGFRVLASNGIDLPVLNVFRMFSKMSGQRVAVQSTLDAGVDVMMKNGVRDRPDVSAMAALEPHKLSVLLWHYHDDDITGPDAAIELSLRNLPLPAGAVRLQQYRIDQTHSNAFTAWQKMNSPQTPTPEQIAVLEKAGQLETFGEPTTTNLQNGSAVLPLILPRQAVALLIFDWDK